MCLKALPALRSLNITSSGITALDVLALGELCQLTALQLTAMEHDTESGLCVASTLLQLQPLRRLTALQQLSIMGWQPLGRYDAADGEPDDVVPPIAAADCCLPMSGQLASLRLSYEADSALVKWVPVMQWCTSLQRLELVLGVVQQGGVEMDWVMDTVTEHLTGVKQGMQGAAVDWFLRHDKPFL